MYAQPGTHRGQIVGSTDATIPDNNQFEAVFLGWIAPKYAKNGLVTLFFKKPCTSPRRTSPMLSASSTGHPACLGLPSRCAAWLPDLPEPSHPFARCLGGENGRSAVASHVPGDDGRAECWSACIGACVASTAVMGATPAPSYDGPRRNGTRPTSRPHLPSLETEERGPHDGVCAAWVYRHDRR
ncbi:MAG: hypothetical protein K0R13_3159 [Propionibacteriaceae bacterium]|nr:hypothetical protein [Propionibacteriaceae bacterium]